MERKLAECESAAVASGYARCTNNACRWYAGAPGLPEVPRPLEVHIRLGTAWLVAREHGGNGHATLRRFPSWESFMEYAKGIGTLSKPGLPAFSNSWD